MMYPFLIRQISKVFREHAQNGGREHTLNRLCCSLESGGEVKMTNLEFAGSEEHVLQLQFN